MIEFCFYARLDYKQFRFVEVNISNQQLDILLDLCLVKVRNIHSCFRNGKDVKSVKLKRAGDSVHPSLIKTSRCLKPISC